MINDILEKILHCIFTTKCAFCDENIEYNKFLCDDCFAKYEILPANKCSSCNSERCCCNKSFSYVISCYVYDDMVKKGIIDMKFNGIGHNASGFAYLMSKQLKESSILKEIDLITEVPMYRKKQLIRGYNQSELIAKYLSKYCNVLHIKRVIKKIKNTKEQNKLNYRLRKVNLINAYQVTKVNEIKDKTVLLVDDVFTTGSTVNECSKMLIKYGAKKVYVATCTIVKHKEE